MSDTLGPQSPLAGSPAGGPPSDADPNLAMPIAPFQSPAAPQKPSLWRSVLAGALTGLAGSARAKGFATGAAGGAGAELNQIASDKATDAAAAKANDEHMQAQASIANTYVNMAHTMAMMKQMDPNSVQSVTKSYNDQMAKGIESGALVAAGPAGEYADVLQQINKLHKSDPTSFYAPVRVPGPDGKQTWQAYKATKAPLQSDAKLTMPDKSERTLPAGQFTGEDVAKIVIGNVQAEAKGMVQKDVNSAKPKPTGPIKVVPSQGSKTGFAYAGIGTDGKFSDMKGDAPAPSAQQFAQTKTIQKFGADGLPHVFAFNPKTNAYDTDQGLSSSGAYGHQAAQATVVARAGEDMIQNIQAHKDQLGTLSAWVQKHGLNTPIADPELAGLQAQLESFSALQPALHGFRSHSALETFNIIIGGLQKKPDATISSIRGILKVAGAMNPTLNKSVGNGTLIYARDEQGHLHSAPAGTKLPPKWTAEK